MNSGYVPTGPPGGWGLIFGGGHRCVHPGTLRAAALCNQGLPSAGSGFGFGVRALLLSFRLDFRCGFRLGFGLGFGLISIRLLIWIWLGFRFRFHALGFSVGFRLDFGFDLAFIQ